MATYSAKATRGSGVWWEIEITDGLPANMVGFSQCKRLTEVEATAKAVVADLLEIDPATVDIEIVVVLPKVLQAKVEAMRKAAEAERAAQLKAAVARSAAAIALLGSDMTMREAGEVLGVSHQRVKQLVDQG